jgi:hypothetical protein
MKSSFLSLLITLFLFSNSLFSQSFKNIEKEFKYVNLPLKMLPANIKTYSFEFIPGNIKWNEFPYDGNALFNFVRLEGYQYQKTGSDLTVSVAFSDLNTGDYTVKTEDISISEKKYSALYKVAIPTVIKIIDKSNNVIDEKTINESIVIEYSPTVINGQPYTYAKSEDQIKTIVAQNTASILNSVKNDAIKKAFYNIKSTINDLYSFIPVVKNCDIMTFKTKKDADFSAWDSNAAKLSEALDNLTNGASPQEIAAKLEPSITFWKSELAKYETNMKENKQLVGAAGYNIVLASIFSNKFDNVNEIATKLKDHNWKYDNELNDLIKFSSSIQKRVEANVNNTIDYKAISQTLPLKINQIEAELTPKGSKAIAGIIEFGDPFYVSPYQNSENITFIPLDIFKLSMGKVKDKDKKVYKPEDVENYKTYGKEFVGTEYSDPTALSLSGNKALLESLISGKANLYIRYEVPCSGTSVGDCEFKSNMDSKARPTIIANVGKKSVVIFNYSAFAELLKDCPAVVEKLKKGEYGNPPIAEKTGKLAKMLEKSKHDNININAVKAAITEYNSLM